MDTLEKLAEKNKVQEKHRHSDNFLTTVMILVLLPLFFGIAIDVGLIESSVNFNLWLYGLGVLCFGLPLAAMGDLMPSARWLKLLGLVTAQGWFVYFWAFQMQSWLAFIPLAPVYIWMKTQMPRIKQQAKRELK
ncbi:hypothetical protein [Shewanella zhangzhouensis]|uniref:hypothetical protein n=1 Tax=Shewanella zhangzhouensis TaxID=2864213 RepID=UPI001C65850E|nr:hypothetical protein [Shewanella zhangzhouensis]QYK06871.1 hypothetical protein K0H63_08775 [Shewanella zhangzhouensis]